MAFIFAFNKPAVIIPQISRSGLCHRRPRYDRCTRLRPSMMSGVNGGIDYEIDLSALPSTLSTRIRSVQQGADSPTDLIDSAQVIAAAVPEYPSVLPVLVDMLGFNNPVAASICVSALSKAGAVSIPSLLTGVAAFNYAVNAYALRAIGMIGDPKTRDVCIACAEKGPIPGVRRAACKALAILNFEDMNQVKEAFELLVRLVENESDWGVRYAAIVGIETFRALHLLANQDIALLERAIKALNLAVTGEQINDDSTASTDTAVCARATIAIEVFKERILSENGVSVTTNYSADISVPLKG